MSVWNHSREAGGELGFDVQKVWEHAERLTWLDADFLDCLRMGFDYLCEDTPPISTFSPHYAVAMEQAAEFFTKIAKAIQKGWFSDPQKMPHVIPLRVLPGSIIEKIESGFRLVWDAS